MFDFSDEPVGRFDDMDPQTDSLLISGRLLENGMIVLLEDPMRRGNERSSSDYDRNEVKTKNRWCRVTSLEARNYNSGSVRVRNAAFVGVYADGTKRVRDVDVNAGWYVKIDSIPPVVPPGEDQQ